MQKRKRLTTPLLIPTLFVTGTDTGVGKTAVAAALAAVLRRRGRSVGVCKPVASGCSTVRNRLISDDALALARAANAADPPGLICPLRYRLPLAPMVAAQLERRPVDLSRIRRALSALAARHDCLIVEGIGGIMVPVTARTCVADLAVELGAPLLVVARTGLGTLNHTLLTLEFARARGLRIAAVVMNPSSPSRVGLAEKTNVAALARLIAPIPVLGPLPWIRGLAPQAGRLGCLPDRLAALDGFDRFLARWLETRNSV